MSAPKSPKGGRLVYQDKFVQMATRACEAGFTDFQIAELFGVNERTINRWKNDHDEFRDALTVGKGPADEKVKRSLYARAIGYSFDAVKIFLPRGSDGPIYAPYVEHVPPDTTACIFWLKNRQPTEWRANIPDDDGAGGGGIVVRGGLPGPDDKTD